MIPLALVCCALLAVLGLVAVRRPVPRRLAVRFALRRPIEALLVVLGCCLGTAALTAALGVGDVLEASLRQRAADRLGPVDVVVRSAAPVVADAVATALAFDAPPDADGVLAMTTGEAALTAPSTGRVVTAVAVGEADLEAAEAFGGEPPASGISGPTPPVGSVVLTEAVAARLGVAAGGEVRLTAYGAERALQVARVVPGRGLAGLALAPGPAPAWVFVTPGLLQELAFARPLPDGARAPERVVLLSGAGDVLGGAARTAALTSQVTQRLATVEGWEVTPLKADELTAAREDAASYASLFGSLGTFTVLAGMALLGNLCLLLAQERRREHGVLRALGLRRGDLVVTAVLEGALYAGVASAVGAVAGVGLTGLVVALADEVLGGAARGGMSLRFAITPASLAIGALSGFSVALLTVAASALRTARLSPVAATGTPPHHRPRALRAALTRTAAAAALTLAAAAAITLALPSGPFAPAAAGWGLPAAGPLAVAMPGLALAASGEALLAWRRRRARRSPRSVTVGTAGFPPLAAAAGRRGRGGEAVVVRRAAAGGAALWALAAFGVLGLDGAQVGLFVAQGLVLSVAGVAALAVHEGGGGGLLGRVRGEVGIALRLARAQRSAGRLRSAGTLLTYVLVTFVLAFSVLLSATFSSRTAQQVADEGGGADLLVTTSAGTPVDASALRAAPGVEDVATLRWGVARFHAPAVPGGQDWPLSGFDADLLRLGPPALATFDRARFADEGAVWAAVLADPGLAIADVAFGQRGGGPPQRQVEVGEHLTVTDLASGREVRREVVAVSSAGAAASGVLVSAESVAQLWTAPVGNRHHVGVAAGADPHAVAGELERANLGASLTARPFVVVVDEALADQAAFFDLIESQLALGLAVGVAGLGVVATRTVRERRRQVAVLRALGCPPSLVRMAFLVESGAVAAQGLALGAGLALLTCSALVTRTDVFGDLGVALAVPWVELGALLCTALAASLLAALPAAGRAARTTPASALRGA